MCFKAYAATYTLSDILQESKTEHGKPTENAENDNYSPESRRILRWKATNKLL